ncbi:NRPS-independent siderophore synthetase rfs-like protein [Cladobotryum mycophilum]|uniref:NRPS-independent siderophore synthetase rfs-like protein n=1 Tax=Cladobotryum mycophilum TaxID=491253 RepID=A0ABR0SS62_9HYPO
MTATATYRAQARAETTKRLLAQLINEGLIKLDVEAREAPQHWHGCISIDGGGDRCLQVGVVGVSSLAGLDQILWRPNNFAVPVLLQSDTKIIQEDDPGSIFEFLWPKTLCDEATKDAIVLELRNSSTMLEKWMDIAAKQPVLDLQSSFLAWERALITGHPTHPFHRTCFASEILEPVGPDDLPDMLNPGLSFVKLPQSAVQVFGPFLRSSHSLFWISLLPAILKFFPQAEALKSIPDAAEAQSAIRTVSVSGFSFDLKFSLACLLTSAVRVLPRWAAAIAPGMTEALRTRLPADLWLIGEVASVTGSQENSREAGHLICILRENLEERAQENNEALILVSALMDKPMGDHRTHAEILFDLTTTARKIEWFTSYVRCLLRLAMDPLQKHGVGFEFHAQNTVARICRTTKQIKGFAIRDLAGIQVHGPTFQKQGSPVNLDPSISTDNVHKVWNRVHHALIQNNIGYMLYALDLERFGNGWAIDIYSYFVKDTMPLKCFMRMRMGASIGKKRISLVEKEIPNVLAAPPWLLQISLVGTRDPKNPVLPSQVDRNTRTLERETLHDNLLKYSQQYGELGGASQRINPHPALVPRQFLEDLELFHDALIPALANIIERWWKDSEANFPRRMPVDPQVEDLLKWVEKSTDEGIMKPLRGHQGHWRPDILLVDSSDGSVDFRVCEINARFPINFLPNAACAYETLAWSTCSSPLIRPATDHKKLLGSLSELFDPTRPLHFLRETLDIPAGSALFGSLRQQTGMKARLISPHQLRLVPSSASKTGFILYSVYNTDIDSSPSTTSNPLSNLITVDGEVLEEIHQIGMQLFDYELFSLPSDVVRHIAMRSVNDTRSVFIAHDKRILGIIRQELDSLVEKHQVLTPAQAEMLRKHIIPTIIPRASSDEATAQVKNNYILKPIREARGNGILLGKHISLEQWTSLLHSSQSPSRAATTTSETKLALPPAVHKYMLQPVVRQKLVSWFWDEERGVRVSRMVGTFYSINGVFRGLGMWRTGRGDDEVISASTKEVTSLVSAVAIEEKL